MGLYAGVYIYHHQDYILMVVSDADTSEINKIHITILGLVYASSNIVTIIYKLNEQNYDSALWRLK